MNEKRFYYSRSTVYGWCVYDRQTQTPAYDACASLLPPVRQDGNGTTTRTPVMLSGEYEAMRLCTKLNGAWWRYQKVINETIEWAKECGEVDTTDMVATIDWAIDNYKFTLEDEDYLSRGDRKIIEGIVAVLEDYRRSIG